MKPVDFLYELTGILVSVGGMMAVLRRRNENKVRNAVALEKNTEATERLTTTVDKLADIVTNQDKRLDKIEYKLWGI